MYPHLIRAAPGSCVGVAARRVSPHDTPLIATDNIATVNQGTVGARQKTVARGFFSLSLAIA